MIFCHYRGGGLWHWVCQSIFESKLTSLKIDFKMLLSQ